MPITSILWNAFIEKQKKKQMEINWRQWMCVFSSSSLHIPLICANEMQQSNRIACSLVNASWFTSFLFFFFFFFDKFEEIRLLTVTNTFCLYILQVIFLSYWWWQCPEDWDQLQIFFSPIWRWPIFVWVFFVSFKIYRFISLIGEYWCGEVGYITY